MPPSNSNRLGLPVFFLLASWKAAWQHGFPVTVSLVLLFLLLIFFALDFCSFLSTVNLSIVYWDYGIKPFAHLVYSLERGWPHGTIMVVFIDHSLHDVSLCELASGFRPGNAPPPSLAKDSRFVLAAPQPQLGAGNPTRNNIADGNASEKDGGPSSLNGIISMALRCYPYAKTSHLLLLFLKYRPPYISSVHWYGIRQFSSEVIDHHDLFFFNLLLHRIVILLTRSVDLNTLHSLSMTCREVHSSLLAFRKQLVKETLRCRNEVIDSIISNSSSQLSNNNWGGLLPNRNGSLNWGKVGCCARDLVDKCQRCDEYVCRVWLSVYCIKMPLLTLDLELYYQTSLIG